MLVLCLISIGRCFAADSGRPDVVPIEFALTGVGKLAKIELRLTVDGTPITEIWDETFAKLCVYFDRNNDGNLDAQEAALLPSPRALRQAISNGLTPPTGAPPMYADLDGNKDGKVTPAELALYYRANGVGNVLIGVGRLPASQDLATALLNNFDANCDGLLSEAELKSTTNELTKLDKNDDELIGAGELVPKTEYPGAAGTVLLTPPASHLNVPEVIAKLPLVLLPSEPQDNSWTTELVKRNSGFKDSTLPTWRTGKPNAVWEIKLATNLEFSAINRAKPFSYSESGIRLQGWIAEGKVGETFESARKQVLAQLDAPVEKSEAETTCRRDSGIAWLVPIADRNDDGKLDRSELDAWLVLQTQIARGQVLLTVLDNAGLFEFLDSNHDGALAVRELSTAWERLKLAGYVNHDKFDIRKFPRGLLIAASQGYPQTLAVEQRRGPVWFRAMDKNTDGDVSRKEFIGPAEVFDKVDTEKDGLLSPAEAAEAKIEK